MFNISTKYSQNSDFRAILVNKSSNLANLRSIIDIKSANEAFITSATTFVTPVVRINNAKISDGRPGKFTKLLREKYIENAKKIAI